MNRPEASASGRFSFDAAARSFRAAALLLEATVENAALEPYEPIITLFLAGRLPRLNHARHLAVAAILKQMPNGRELMHLGLQVTALRAGIPEKYSRAVTDHYWDRLDATLPPMSAFSDI